MDLLWSESAKMSCRGQADRNLIYFTLQSAVIKRKIGNGMAMLIGLNKSAKTTMRGNYILDESRDQIPIENNKL